MTKGWQKGNRFLYLLLLLLSSVLPSTQFSRIETWKSPWTSASRQNQTPPDPIRNSLVISTSSIALESINFPLPALPQPFVQSLTTLHMEKHTCPNGCLSFQSALPNPFLQAEVRVIFPKYKANFDNSLFKIFKCLHNYYKIKFRLLRKATGSSETLICCLTFTTHHQALCAKSILHHSEFPPQPRISYLCPSMRLGCLFVPFASYLQSETQCKHCLSRKYSLTLPIWAG